MYTVPTTAVNQPDGMAYYTNSKSEENISLSCRQGPIRFEVMRKNGLNSYTWKVWVGGDGSAHIVCLTLPPKTVAEARRVLRCNGRWKEGSWFVRGPQGNRS